MRVNRSLFSVRFFVSALVAGVIGFGCAAPFAQPVAPLIPIDKPLIPSSHTLGLQVPGLTNAPLLLKTGLVSGGLSVSLSQAGVPDAVALDLVRELSQSFNVDEDVSTEDRFTVLYEAPLIGNSGTQKLLAFEYVNKGKTITAFWFETGSATGKGGYYLADGSSLRPAFLRTPIEIVRVTSGFGARKVPRRKLWRNHDGVDFGAPIGTPIFAAADGTVEVMRSERGFGKVVKLAHPKNAQTIYAHMSAFATDLSEGKDVRQGEVIGYVGRTGWATGAHLHYEYRVDNIPIDPFSDAFPRNAAVEKAQMAAFSGTVAALQQRFNAMKRLINTNASDVSEPDPASSQLTPAKVEAPPQEAEPKKSE